MKIEGKHFGEAWVLISVAWLVNLICFMAFYWGGEYLTLERGVLWIEKPLIATLWTLGISKFMLSIGLVSSIIHNFNDNLKNEGKK